jgi:iron complex transport system substrate-binding protein
LQADIAADLIRQGVAVINYNQRTVAGILAMIRSLGALTGVPDRAEALVQGYERRIAELKARTKNHPRPLVYFEEWDTPIISGIAWVSELIEIAGGREAFPELPQHQAAKDRILRPEQVIERAPDIIIASWCGKKVRPEKIAARPGWDVIPAVRDGRIYEIKSPLILQPGPAALSDGLDAICEILGS